MKTGRYPTPHACAWRPDYNRANTFCGEGFIPAGLRSAPEPRARVGLVRLFFRLLRSPAGRCDVSLDPFTTDRGPAPFTAPNRCMRKQAGGVKYISQRFIVADLRFIK
ncbi:MAG: hypothetical protein E5X05_00430 [Mesorhizobium sp.]|nr:MAG: hypothetical protein E5X05_00430 [Mesorhizobium sp.]